MLEELNERITQNLDLIPVEKWGYGNSVLEEMKTHRHTVTNKHLSLDEKKSLNKIAKKKIARGTTASHNTVSEVLEWMKDTRLADVEPKKPKKALEEDSANAGFVFSNLKFSLAPSEEETKEPKSAKRDKFHGRDYKRLLHKAEKREERLNELKEKNPEKAEKIEENIQWNRALERAKGNKVKDDIPLLKKSLKGKMKMKDRRKKKWENRESEVKQRKEKKQERRQANIQKRKDDKIKNKQKKRLKKGT